MPRSSTMFCRVPPAWLYGKQSQLGNMLASLSTEIGRSKLKICAKKVMPLLSALQIDSNLNALRRWNMTTCYLDPQREFNTAALILNSRSDTSQPLPTSFLDKSHEINSAVSSVMLR